MKTLKPVVRNLLLAFVLISIGFALGRETAPRPAAATAPATLGQETGAQVRVTYLRSTFRCITCNLVETLADELIRAEFADALEAGRLEWRAVDYLREPELAGRYQVSGNMIVVARFENGQEVRAIRLDRVMEEVMDADRFRTYVRDAIVQALERGDL